MCGCRSGVGVGPSAKAVAAATPPSLPTGSAAASALAGGASAGAAANFSSISCAARWCGSLTNSGGTPGRASGGFWFIFNWQEVQ